MQMRRTCEILAVISVGLFASMLWAQETTEGTATLPREVSAYFDLMQSSQSLKQLSSMPIEDLKHIAAVAYEASATHPVALQKELQTRHHWPVNPTVFRIALNRAVKDRISRLDFALVAVPYFLKAKILRIYTHPDKLSGGPPGVNLSLPITDITATVEEVIKGASHFSPSDTINFYFFPIWRPTTSRFGVGEIDFLPLQPVLSQGQLGLSLVTDLDTSHAEYGAGGPSKGSYGRYPIVNGKVTDLDNTFGGGSSVTWETFKEDILREIEQIRSW